MTLSADEFALVAAELSAGLVGARVQKIAFSDRQTVTLELRLPGRSIHLFLMVVPGAGRVSIVAHKPASPARALAVQGLWRNHLNGARLDVVEPLGRGLRLRFSTDDGARSVIIEVERSGGELFLLDPQDRMLPRGKPHLPPAADRHAARNRLENIPDDGQPFPIARKVEELEGAISADRQLTDARTQLIAALKTAHRRLARTIGKVREDRSRITEAERYRQLGDLLKPMLTRIPRGAREVSSTEYGPDGAREVIVPLLPNLGPRENMERYYHLHRRLSRSSGRVEERLGLLESQLATLDRLLKEAVEAAQVDPLRAEAEAQGLLRTPSVAGPRAAPTERRPFKEFLSASGARIWVGRNARDNDALTFRLARGNDLWLHARGQTGSHVIVPGVGEQGPDGETLLDAAELAAHFSAGRDETLVEVAATRCKYVRKPKGAAAGAVTFSQERTITLRRDPVRLARLLATERPR